MSSQSPIVVTIEEQAPFVVELVAQQGPAGPPGEQGEQGPAGQDGADLSLPIDIGDVTGLSETLLALNVYIEETSNGQGIDASSWGIALDGIFQPANPFLDTLVGIGTTTGTGAIVRAISPTLTTPNIGAATGTSLIASGLVQGSALRVGNSNGQIDLSGTILVFTNATAIRIGANTLLTSGGAFRNAANSADAPISCSNLTASGTVTTNGQISAYGAPIQQAASAVASTSATLDSIGGFPGLWFTAVATSRNTTNYSLLGVGGQTIVNSLSGNPLNLRIGNADALLVSAAREVSIPAGGLSFGTVAKGITYKSGTGQRAGNATLVSGIVTVTNTSITANSVIILSRKTSGGTIGNLTYTLSAGASFTINSDSLTDTSVVSYEILEVV